MEWQAAGMRAAPQERPLLQRWLARSIDKMALWGRGDDITGGSVYAGVDVSQSSALRLVAVYACVRLIAETVASLPADAVRKRGEERELVPRQPMWLGMPNPETTWFEMVERCLSSLNLDGNAFLLITARDNLGFPAEFFTLDPREIVVRRENGRTFFVWGGDQVLSRYSPSNPLGDVLHIKAFNDGGLRGLSPIDVARQAIGLGLATEKYGSKFFGVGQGSMPGVIEFPEASEKKTDEAIEQMRVGWAGQHSGADNAHKPGILTGGATWKTISISHEDAQFLETRKFQVVEIARLYRVPPHLIQELDTTTSWGTGIEQQSIGFVRYSLLPWLVRLEKHFDQMLPRGQFLKFDVRGLLRGDSTAQAERYAKLIQNGVMSRNEVRALEDLPAEADLDDFLYPSSLTVVGQTPAPVSLPPDEGSDDAASAS